MKAAYLFGLLLFSFPIHNNIQAQGFQSLFERFKQEFNSSISNQANRLIDESLGTMNENIGRFRIATKKSKNSKEAKDYKNVRSNISSNAVDEYISITFPRFNHIYQDVYKNDPLVKEINFIISEQNDWQFYATADGNLIINMQCLDGENKFPENQLMWVFLIQVGRIHFFYDNKLKFEFALKKAFEYAQIGNCGSLKSAVNKWQYKTFPSNDQALKSARDIVIQTNLFKEAAEWVRKNPNCQ